MLFLQQSLSTYDGPGALRGIMEESESPPWSGTAHRLSPHQWMILCPLVMVGQRGLWGSRIGLLTSDDLTAGLIQTRKSWHLRERLQSRVLWSPRGRPYRCFPMGSPTGGAAQLHERTAAGESNNLKEKLETSGR